VFFVSSYRYNTTALFCEENKSGFEAEKLYKKKGKKKVSVFLRTTLLYFPPVFILRSFVNLKGLGRNFLDILLLYGRE